MKLPRDISGGELAQKLEKYEYRITRQTGSHIRLTSNLKSTEHYITIPLQDSLKIGALSSILHEVTVYLELQKKDVITKLFES